MLRGGIVRQAENGRLDGVEVLERAYEDGVRGTPV